MNRLWKWALCVAVPGGAALGLWFWWKKRRDDGALARMTVSSTATKHGLDNQPKTDEQRRLIYWLDRRRAEVLALVQRIEPGAKMTSAFRAPAVNAKVGGHPESLHMVPLAFDVGGLANEAAAKEYLEDNEGQLEIRPARVLNEGDHLHVEYSNPFDQEQPMGVA